MVQDVRAQTLLTCLVALLAPAVSAEEEAPPRPDGLQVRLKWTEGLLSDYHARKVDLTAEPPALVQPLEDRELAHYAALPLGKSRVLLFATEAGEEEKENVLWVDLNFDGNLRDEKAIQLRKVSGTYRCQLTLEIPTAPGAPPVAVPVIFFRSADGSAERMSFCATAHRTGSVVLGGRLRRIALYDNDGDLQFGRGADRAYLDLDGNGRLSKSRRTHERLRLGESFRAGRQGWTLHAIGAYGVHVAFRPASEVPPRRKRAWIWQTPDTSPALRARGMGVLATLIKRYEAERLDLEQATYFRSTYRCRSLLGSIGQVGTEEAFKFLRKVYKSEKASELRKAAVMNMGYVQYVRHAPAIAKIARAAKNPEVRRTALTALHHMAAPGREAFFAQIVKTERDGSTCGLAARFLAGLDTATAQTTLRQIAMRHSRPATRYYAYGWLTKYARKRPTPALVRMAAASLEPRLAALGLEHAQVSGFDDLPALARQALKRRTRNTGLQLAAVEILGSEAGPDEVAILLPLATSSEASVRGRITDLLRLTRDPAVNAALITNLAHGDPAVRHLAITILVALPGNGVDGALIERLPRETVPRNVGALLRAVAARPDPSAAKAVISAARRHRKDPKVFSAAVDALGRIGLRDPIVQRFFEEQLRAGSWEERVVALDALAQTRQAAVTPHLLRHLDHSVWQVRLTVVEGLGLVRTKEAVAPLIGRLRREDHARVRRAITESLFRITGQNFYDLADLWEQWWRDQRTSFTVPKEVPKLRRLKEGRTVATFYGLPVETDRIIFVIDKSGSMDSFSSNVPSELQKAVDEVLKVVGHLKSSARANVILFDDRIRPWRKGMPRLTAKVRKGMERFLRSQNPDGGTNLYDGLALALKAKGVDTVYLLSDGAPGSGKFVRDEDILREVRKINRTRRVTIHCVALGHRSSLLAKLAEQNGGNYVTK